MSVGIDEPPAPVHLFHTEEAGRIRLRVQIAAIFAVAEIARAQARFLGDPVLLQLLQARDLAGPVRRDPLAEPIHYRLRVEDGGTRILLRQTHRANLDRWLSE